jgi:hypothetical protein
VLVESSSTTPHLLIRKGAIYVRNPGSSDPVPIADQGLLFTLMERGEAARERARQEAVRISEGGEDLRYVLALAPTGWPDEFAIGKDVPELISLRARGEPSGRREGRPVVWGSMAVTVTRHWESAAWEEFQEPVRLWRNGGLTLGFGGGQFPDEPRNQGQLGSWFDEQLVKGARFCSTLAHTATCALPTRLISQTAHNVIANRLDAFEAELEQAAVAE